MYHFKEPHIKITQEWLQTKVEIIDCLPQMKVWRDEVNFLSKPLSKFHKSIQIVVILLAIILRRKDASSSSNKWV